VGDRVASGKQLLQFGIRQLMVVTTLVAVLLGAGRLLVPYFAKLFSSGGWNEAPVFFFLAAAGVVMTVPLLLAALLPRFAVRSSLVIVALTILATGWELQLLQLVSGPSPVPNFWHFLSITAFQTTWILAVVSFLRYYGYRLVRCVDRLAGDSTV